MRMTQIFTLNQNDVIRYLYNETSPQENDLIVEALLFDADLLGFYLEVAEVKHGLDSAMLAPPQRIVDDIISYSNHYAFEN